MTNAVNKTGLVKRFLVKYFFKIGGYFLLIVPVLHIFLYIVEHRANLNIRSAVLRAFERAERRCDCGICVRSRGRYNMRGKGRVITAAVLCVKHQCRVKHLGFKRGILAVEPQHIKYVFCGGKLGARLVNEKAVAAAQIIIVRMITVYRKQRKPCNKLQALAQHIRNRGVLCVCVIGIKR